MALIVAGCHSAWFDRTSALFSVLNRFSALTAVLGFLLISKFFIAASLEKDRENFYVRRAIRVLPLYILAVVGSALLPIIFPGRVAFENDTPLVAPTYCVTVLNLCFTQGLIASPVETNPVVCTL